MLWVGGVRKQSAETGQKEGRVKGARDACRFYTMPKREHVHVDFLFLTLHGGGLAGGCGTRVCTPAATYRPGDEDLRIWGQWIVVSSVPNTYPLLV